MLAELQIRNFAIIDELFLSFGPGLTVITGETGAGKSILVNAINLLLGSRGSADLVRRGSREAVVAGLFRPAAPLDPGGLAGSSDGGEAPELLLQRTLTAGGRSRVQVNGQLATVGSMARLCRGLASISGQHEHQLFLEPAVQLQIIDQFGGLEQKRQAYQESFARLQALRGELGRLRRRARQRREKEELHRFQLEEIGKAQIQADEEVELARERERLQHAERLQRGALGIHQILYSESGAVLEQLGQCRKLLAELAELDQTLEPLCRSLEEVGHQLEDVSFSLRDYGARLESDPARLEWLEERLHLLNRLMRKYGGSTGAVLARAEQLERELQQAESDELEIAAAEKELEEAGQEAVARALELSRGRRRSARRLSQALEQGLASLDMPRCRFRIDFQPPGSSEAERIRVGDYFLDGEGLDRVVYLFSANPGEEPRPMSRIASGGELSRIVLALKELLAGRGAQESLIFDEVDAGIGGRTADLTGRRLKALAHRHQVICITHLPQIACYGDHHYVVRKSTSAGRTVASIQEVSGKERLEEIARMLGGVKISARTRAHAREMLEQVQKSGEGSRPPAALSKNT